MHRYRRRKIFKIREMERCVNSIGEGGGRGDTVNLKGHAEVVPLEGLSQLHYIIMYTPWPTN